VLIKASRGNAGHHQAEGLFTGIGRLLADDMAGEHDKDTV
jgi:imidazoleglycerol phosphate dehydratase HisB